VYRYFSELYGREHVFLSPVPFIVNPRSSTLSRAKTSFPVSLPRCWNGTSTVTTFPSYKAQTNRLKDLELEDLVVASSKDKANASLYNAASGIWNHNFFWQCMKPGGVPPNPHLLDLLKLHFGGLERFQERFGQFARAHFGSGWVWLVDKDGHLEVTTTSNSNSPLTTPQLSPLLVLDVWEHAYYQDHGEDRDHYVRTWWRVVDWDFVWQNLQKAQGKRTWHVTMGLKDVAV